MTHVWRIAKSVRLLWPKRHRAGLWELTLPCGHMAMRSRSGRSKPPKRVACWTCEQLAQGATFTYHMSGTLTYRETWDPEKEMPVRTTLKRTEPKED